MTTTTNIAVQANEPNVVVVNGDKTVTITTPELQVDLSGSNANVNQTEPEVTATTPSSPDTQGIVASPDLSALVADIETLVSLSGLGEGNIPSPGLFNFTPDFIEITDTINLLLSTGRLFEDSISIVDSALKQFGKQLSDTTVLSDIFSTVVDFNRTVLDSISATDDVLGVANIDDDQYVTFGKFLVDTSTITDSISTALAINRTLTESFSTTELLEFQSTKVISDFVYPTDDILGEAVIDDDQYATFGKNLIDTNTITDTIVLLSAFDRLFTDNTTLIENISIGVNSQYNDSISFVDNILFSVGLFRTFSDSFSIGESLSFNINSASSDSIVINDTIGIVAEYNRSFTDTATLIENISIGVNSQYNDSISFVDNISFSTGFLRTFSDSFSITESLLLNINSVSLDSIAINDTVEIVAAYARNITDSITLNEILSLAVASQYNDSISINELISFNAGSRLVDNTTLSDIFSSTTSFNRIVSDFVYPTDDILGEAVIDDDQYATFGKNLTDTNTITDTIALVASYLRTITDNFSFTENVSLIISSSIQDTLLSSDSVLLVFTKEIRDTVSFIENVVISLGNARIVTDTITISESKTAFQQSYFQDTSYTVSDYVGQTYTI